MMKNCYHFLLLIGCLSFFVACESGGGASVKSNSYQVDQSDPAKVLQAVFDVAAGAEASILGDLCDPKQQNDGDTRRICDLSTGFEQDDEFVQYFENAKLTGEVRTENSIAYVPFLFGPDGDREEIMELVERDGKWYLMSF